MFSTSFGQKTPKESKKLCVCHSFKNSHDFLGRHPGPHDGSVPVASLWLVTHRRLPSHSDHFTAHLRHGDTVKDARVGPGGNRVLDPPKKKHPKENASMSGFRCFFLVHNYTKDRQCWNLKLRLQRLYLDEPPARAADVTLTQILATQPRWCPKNCESGNVKLKYRVLTWHYCNLEGTNAYQIYVNLLWVASERSVLNDPPNVLMQMLL